MFKTICLFFLMFLLASRVFSMEEKPTANEDRREIASKVGLVDELIALLDDKELRTTNRRAMTHVIELLGEVKARKSVHLLVRYIDFIVVQRPVLYENIEFRSGRVIWHNQNYSVFPKGTLYRHHPALVALVRIGEPSIEPALELLKKSKSGSTCHTIINLFYGVRGEKGLDDLKKIFAEEKDPVAKAIFEDYLGDVKKENFIYPEVKKAREIRLLEDDPSQYGSPAQQYRETWQRDPIKFDEKLLPKPEPFVLEDEKPVKEPDEKKSEK